MLEDDATSGLKGRRPSERSDAISWFLAHATPQHATLLTEAVESETVPSLRRLLEIALSHATRGVEAPETTQQIETATPEYSEILENIAGLIRHETEPVIGWLRRGAAGDIGPTYETSETFRNIELLRQRLSGLETLALAHQIPRWKSASLGLVIKHCAPPDLQLKINGGPFVSDEIDTDPGLLSIIVGNALQNAREAVREFGDKEVHLEYGITDRDFWISIANRFSGQGFDYDFVAHTGSSSKANHKGLGLTAIRLAAQRLGYDVTVTAQGGTAFFALRGRRHHG